MKIKFRVEKYHLDIFIVNLHRVRWSLKENESWDSCSGDPYDLRPEVKDLILSIIIEYF